MHVAGPRPARARRASVRLAPLAALALAASLAGCDRTPRLVPASADSTRAAADTFAILARDAGAHWESGSEDEAADLSARAAFEALRRRPAASAVQRVRDVLDSLGFAAEVVGDDHTAIANLFSRAEPEGPSWPFLFWREAAGPRRQSIEGRGLHLMDAVTLRFDREGRAGDSSQVAALFGRRSGAGQQPIAMVWRHARGGRWDLVQTLGSDSLGGTGTGEFAAADSGVALETRTFRATPFFDECATCPHLYRSRRFLLGPRGFVRVEDRLVPSTYSTFANFIAALVAGERDRAAKFVVDPTLIEFARRYEWHQPAKGRWRVAPATDETAQEMIFFRGANEAYRVLFEPREGDWRIAGFEATARSLE